jgi:hypothetical protein
MASGPNPLPTITPPKPSSKAGLVEGTIKFRIKGLGIRAIDELVIFRNNEIVHRIEPKRKKFDLGWTDNEPPAAELVWYYARIHTKDEELAWSSPIWFTG